MRRALDFPAHSVAHLSRDDPWGDELTTLAALERGGLPLGLLVLPAAVEDSFYRYNNLPVRLGDLYTGVDPSDPDEDLLEEAEPAAAALIDQAYLLDEVIDAIYQSLATLPADLVVRRADHAEGLRAANGRPVLLALKRLFKRDWETSTVMRRLASDERIGIDARPVLVHDAREAASETASAEAASLLGRQVRMAVDPSGRTVRAVSGS